MKPELSFAPRSELGRAGFRATAIGAGDLADRSLPLETCVAMLRRALDFGVNVFDTAPSYENGYSEQIVGQALRAEGVPELPHLTVEECIRYTLTCDPDVALLGLSFPNEQDAAFEAAREYQPFSLAELDDVRRRAALAMAGKGRTWWNPE